MGWTARPRDIKIRALQRGIDPTGRAIASAIGVPYVTIKRLMAEHPVSTDTAVRVCVAFGCASTAELFDGDAGLPPLHISPASRRRK